MKTQWQVSASDARSSMNYPLRSTICAGMTKRAARSMEIVEMQDRLADGRLLFIRQNKGTLSKSAGSANSRP